MAKILIIASLSLTICVSNAQDTASPSEVACNLPLELTSVDTHSFHNLNTYPNYAKINGTGGYRAEETDKLKDKFVWVTFDTETVVTGVAMQGYGDPEIKEWVKQYYVGFTRQSSSETFYVDRNGRPKLFQGNNDSNTIVRNNFAPENVEILIIEPSAYHINVAFRFELYGCIMKRSVELHFRWRDEHCTLEMLIDKKSDGFKVIETKLESEMHQISRLPGVQVVKLESLRPGSLIVGIKVGVRDSQVKQMIVGAKQLLKNFTKFDSSFFAVKDPKGSSFCTMPNISLSNLSHDHDKTLKINRSASYIVRAFINSETQQKTLVTWKIAQLQNSRRKNVDRKNAFKSTSISMEETVLGNTTIIQKEISKHTLQYGVYYIEVLVNATGCMNYNYGFLRVTETPLHVAVSTKPPLDNILKGYHRYLEFNASNSFDPDVQKKEQSGLTFTWLCARKNETFGNTATLPVVVPHNSGNRLNVKGCYGSGPGKLNFTGAHAKLLLDQMEPNKSYIIQLIVEKDSRKENVSYEFELKSGNSFHLEIRCKRNCKQKVNPAEKISFEGFCDGDSCKQNNTYFRWSLFAKTDIGEFQPVIIQNNEDRSLLEIDMHVLEEGKKYELQLRGNLTEKIRSSATYPFTTNQSPRGGNCTVDRFTGQVLVTNFTFSCFGWLDEDKDLIYQFGYKSSSGVYEILQESPSPYLKTNKLPLGDSEKENMFWLDIYVKDQWGGFGSKTVKVKILSSRTINATTLYRYTMGNNSEMAKLLESEDGGKDAMRLANTLLSVMSATTDKEVKKEDKIKFKDEMIKHSSKVKVNDLQGIILVTSVVASATDKSEELSEKSQWTSVDVLERMTNKFQNITVEGSDKDPTGIEKAGNNLLVGIGNVLDANAVKADTNNKKDETSEESSKVNLTKTKVLAEKAFILITKVGDSMLSSREVDDEPVEIETKAIFMRLNRQTPGSISDKPTKIKDSKVTFPPSEELLGPQAQETKYVDTQMLSLKHNPFSWDKSAKLVKSAVISIDLKNDKGEVLEVSELSHEIELYIKTDRPQTPQVPLHSFVKPSVNGSMRNHRVVISEEGMVVSVKVVPSNGSKLQVYFRYLRRPTISNYDFMAEVPDFTSCKRHAKGFTNNSSNEMLSGYFNCTKDPYVLTLSSDVTSHIGLHYIGIRLPGSDDFSKEIKRRRRSCSENERHRRSEMCVEFKDPPTTPPPTPRVIVPEYDPSTDVNYTLSISMGACLYWSEAKEKWTSYGCRVGPKPVNGSVQCLCTHLSAFGGDFLVAPNPIDFDQVWDAFSNILETKNFVVLGTVCAMLGIYLIVVVFARRADQSDRQKVTQVIPLGDVYPNSHCYELKIYTGLWRLSGTSANVAVMIYGDIDTDVIPLNCSTMCDKKLFARGSVNTFILSLKESLGDISHIKIWHDNSGENPQWFVNKIVIRDATSDTTWHFLCNRWIAAEREDGKIERVFYASSTKEVNSFKNKFYSRVSMGLGDGHVWLSVITRPPTSSFTRVQRVSCCLSVLMSAMVTNAMFYQFGAMDTDNAFHFGPFVLSWRQIIIGLQSAVLVVPVNVLIVFLFRNSRRRQEVTQAFNTNSDNFSVDETHRTGCFLSRFFVYIAWALCILTSLTSAAFTVFYSMMWGTEVSNKWLTSILVSFTQDILFIQPIKVVIVASLLALLIKKAPEDESDKENEKSVAQSIVKGESHKPLKPDNQQLEKFREYRLRVMVMARVLIELAFYLIFAWALMTISYGRRDTGHYWMTKGIDDLLPKFDRVRDTNTFWAWTQKYLVPAVYDVKWYNGQPFEYKEGFMSDMSGYLVGMPRFRQLRVIQGPCPISPRYSEFRETLHPCLPPYSGDSEDQTLYSMPQWRKISTNETVLLSEFALLRMCPRPWRYKTSEELQSIPLQGLRALYGGGGFVADLGYTKASALRVITNLQNNSWIDEKTRAVLIEFMVFDSSTNLFSAVSYIYEALPLGGAATFKRINTMSLYGATGKRSFSAVCELIVLLMVFYFITAEAVKIWKEKCFYFKSAWAYVEMAQILSAIATVVLSIFQRYYTTKLVNRIHANPFETSSFHYTVMWSDLENALIAVLVFILTIKVLKILQFNEHISSLAASMVRCRAKIVSYSAVFMVAFLAFMQVALLVFGSTTKAYSSVSEVFRTQFGLFIGGDTDYQDLKSANRIIGPIYFFLFMTTMASILINMFLAILNESYREVRVYPDREHEEAEMLRVFLDYAKKKVSKKLTSFQDTKFLPRRDSYSVQNHHSQYKKRFEEDCKYTPINWTNCDSISEKGLVTNDNVTESSFLEDIKKRLRNISSELRDISILHRSRRYKVYEVQKKYGIQDQKFDEDLRVPCRGLGIEKVSSKCSLFSLSESTMYIDRLRKGRDSVRKLLGNEDSSDVEDTAWDDGTSYAESMTTFFGGSGTIYDMDREPFRDSDASDFQDRESYI